MSKVSSATSYPTYTGSKLSINGLPTASTSLVNGVNESIVFKSFAPITSPTFKQSLGMFKSPESTISGNISGSSKLSAEIIINSIIRISAIRVILKPFPGIRN